jgi:hypothetical protein
VVIQLAFIFKCLCDMVILDDFKTALDRMRAYWLRRMDSLSIPSMSSSTHHDHHHPHDRNPSYPLHSHDVRRPSDFIDLESAPGGGGGGGVGWLPPSTTRPEAKRNRPGPAQAPKEEVPSEPRHLEHAPDEGDGSSSESAPAELPGYPFPKAMYLEEIRGVPSPRR